jgi:hypothetical protein
MCLFFISQTCGLYFYTETLPKLIKILYSIEEKCEMFLFFSNISIVVYSFFVH